MALSIAAGQRVTADVINNFAPVYVVKGSDTSRTSTTTTAPDPHLVVTLRAGITYRIEAEIGFTAATAGDIRLDWSVTGTVAGVTTRRQSPQHTRT